MIVADIEKQFPPAGSVMPALVDRVAMISVHTSPVAVLGGKDSGGLNVYVSELSKQLSQRGIAVDIFTRKTNPCDPTIIHLDENLRVINVEAGPVEILDKDTLFCHLPDFASEVAYMALREGLRYDVIHSHYWLSGWAGALLKQHWNVPLVQTYHTMAHLKNAVAINDERETTLRLQMERRLTQTADALIASNPVERQEMVRKLGASDESIHLVPPGIDLSIFSPGNQQDARRVLNLPDGPLILFVGRIDPVKGIETLFSGLAEMHARCVDDSTKPKLVFIGGTISDADGRPRYDEDLQYLHHQADVLGISGHVLFQGSQPRELLPTYYRAVDVCAVPSRYESFGLVAVEAMASGIPVIASRVGGLQFSVKHEISGLLIEHTNPLALANALERIMSDSAFSLRLRSNARAVAEQYSWESVCGNIVRVYEQLSLGAEVNECYSEEVFAS